MTVFKRASPQTTFLYQKVVSFLTTFIAIPVTLLALFSLVFLYFGLSTWFDKRVQTAIFESQNIARAYLVEHQEVVRNNMELFVRDMQDLPLTTLLNPDFLNSFLNLQAGIRSFNRALLLDKSGHIIGRSTFSTQLKDEFKTWPPKAEGIHVTLNKQNDHVLAVTKPLDDQSFLLVVSKRVDPHILQRITKTEKASEAYGKLLKNRWNLTLQFILIFSIVILLVLFLTLKRAMYFSKKLVKPIDLLTRKAKKLEQGDFSPAKQAAPQNDIKEVTLLFKAFDQMTSALSTQQNQLKRTHAELAKRHSFTKHVLSNISSGVIVINAAGVITFYNQQAASILECSKKDIHNKKLEQVCAELAAYSTTEEHTIESHIKLADSNTTLRVLSRKGFQNTTILTFENISRLLMIQKQAAWTDVARRVAHEIKNPLTPIQLSAERLKRLIKKKGSPPESFYKSIDIIERQVKSLAHMLTSFLSFSKMPDPQLAPIHLSTVLKNIIALEKEAYPDITLSLDIQDEKPINGDTEQLHQALINLVHNSLEAIQSRQEEESVHGAIAIRIFSDNRCMTCTITDNGSGLPAQDKLSPVHQVGQSTKKNGSGLGLSIVQKIISDHKGFFHLSNRKDEKGVCATVCLPCYHASHQGLDFLGTKRHGEVDDFR